MNFLNPWAFLGLLSLPAIIALHWHFQRKSRVVVSSMFLWRFLDEKFQGNKMNFLHISLLLLLDLLVALLLTLALTRPVLKLPAPGAVPRQQVILLDDSASMLALDGTSDRFSNAQQVAQGIIAERGPNDEIVLVTFGGGADLVAHAIGPQEIDLAALVREQQAYGSGEDLRAGLAIARRLENPRLPQKIYVITDGAFPAPQLDDFAGEIEWIFVGDGDNNQAVLDLSMETSRQTQSELFFRLANYSAQSIIREVEISVDGSPLTSLAVELAPNSITPQTVALTGVQQSVTVRLLGMDQMPADDTAYLGAAGADPVEVAIVADNPYPLDRAVQTIPGTSLKVYSPAVLLNQSAFDLVIYRNHIPSVWPDGTVLLFDPPPPNSVIPIGPLEEVEEDLEVVPGTILEGAGLESVRWEVAFNLGDVQEFKPIASVDGNPFVLHRQTGQSDIYLFAPLLNSGNFTKHPAFPILLSRFVARARDFNPQPAYLSGDSIALPEGEVSIQFPSGESVTGDQTRQVTMSDPGLYRYTAFDSLGGRREVLFGVNVGEEAESNITSQDWRAGVTIYTTETDSTWQRVEVHLGPWLLVMAVILLLVEAWRAWR